MTLAPTRFALQSHPGPYDTWPLTSALLQDGEPTRVRLPGYVLLAQYETVAGLLFITDYDCPFEEATAFTLYGADLSRRLGRKEFVVPYGSWSFKALDWLDARNALVHFYGDECWHLQLPEPRWWRPAMRWRRMGEGVMTDAEAAALGLRHKAR
ncbi:MAG TPA: hypothetical protein VLC08_05145 [Chitinolyticbacter sp.]|nr:hypothetical protein [Chitinolyticbacter sp.]